MPLILSRKCLNSISWGCNWQLSRDVTKLIVYFLKTMLLKTYPLIINMGKTRTPIVRIYHPIFIKMFSHFFKQRDIWMNLSFWLLTFLNYSQMNKYCGWFYFFMVKYYLWNRAYCIWLKLESQISCLLNRSPPTIIH